MLFSKVSTDWVRTRLCFHIIYVCVCARMLRLFVQNAATTPCELCKMTGHTGGAMKQVGYLGGPNQQEKMYSKGPSGEKLWAHVSCSLWIPEVREQ